MFTLNCKGRLLVIDKPVVMGIINITPDSFYAGSRLSEPDAVLKQAEKMLAEGAAILDLGAQSTRPGSREVGAEEELRRLLDPVSALHRRFPEAIISVDTYRGIVAREMIEAGASMINDIGGGSFDDTIIPITAQLGVPYICMHVKGTPDTMHKDPSYENVALEVLDYFIAKTDECKKAGIHDVIVDPGFGFSKTPVHNFRLLQQLSVLKMLGRPILAGLSRKSTVYRTLGVTAEEALNGTTVLNTISLLNGADILRVHDVKEAMEAIRLVQAYQETEKASAV